MKDLMMNWFWPNNPTKEFKILLFSSGYIPSLSTQSILNPFNYNNYFLSLELEVYAYQELENITKKFREEFADNINNFEIIFNTQEYKYEFYPFD